MCIRDRRGGGHQVAQSAADQMPVGMDAVFKIGKTGPLAAAARLGFRPRGVAHMAHAAGKTACWGRKVVPDAEMCIRDSKCPICGQGAEVFEKITG